MDERMTDGMINKILFCFMIVCVIGCALKEVQLVRIDQDATLTKSGAYYPARAQNYKYTFPKRRSIQKIIVHTNGPVPNLAVYAQKEKDMWHKIKEVKTPINGTYEFRVAVTTDGIRVSQSGGRPKQRVGGWTRPEIAEITSVEFYGPPGQD